MPGTRRRIRSRYEAKEGSSVWRSRYDIYKEVLPESLAIELAKRWPVEAKGEVGRDLRQMIQELRQEIMDKLNEYPDMTYYQAKEELFSDIRSDIFGGIDREDWYWMLFVSP